MTASNQLRGRAQRSHLFISYSRSDRIAVDEIVEKLRSRNYRLWIDVDEQGIEPGEDWRKELAVQMTAAEAVIACVSPDFLRSKFCQAEIAQAKRESKPIFPVLVRRLDEGQSLADIGIDNLQYLDLTDDFDGGLKRLMAVIPRPARRIPPVAGVIAVVAVLLVVVGLATYARMSTRSNIILPETAAPVATTAPTLTTAPIPTATPLSLTSYDLGVAVAYFALPDDGSVDQAAADALAEQIGARLEHELGGFARQADLTLGFLMPGQSGRIQGSTGAERADSAREFARQTGADFILYGQIAAGSGGKLEFQPELYLAPDSFGDALEITGAYAFGHSIEVEDSSSAASGTEESSDPLSARVAAAALVLTGVRFYALEDYEDARDAFEQALALPGWEDAEGRAVLHVLAGSAYTRLASVALQSGEITSALQQLDAADEQYGQAREFAPDNARVFSGLASDSFLRWGIDGQQGNLDLSLLDTALDNVQQAEDAADQTPDAGLQIRLLLTRVQVRFSQWAYHSDAYTADELTDIYNDFESSAQTIIQRYDEGENPSLQPLASETYSYLATAQYALSDWTTAAESYRQAIALSTPRQRVFYYGYLGNTLMQMGSYEPARVAYEEALRLADDVGSVPESITAYYRRQLNSLDGQQ